MTSNFGDPQQRNLGGAPFVFTGYASQLGSHQVFAIFDIIETNDSQQIVIRQTYRTPSVVLVASIDNTGAAAFQCITDTIPATAMTQASQLRVTV